MVLDIRELFKLAKKEKASDLHLTVHAPPILRIDGKLKYTDFDKLSAADTKNIIYGILTDDQKEKFERDLELDFSLSMPGINRFRVNVHKQRGCVEAAFRVVSFDIRSIEELGLPSIVADLARKSNGLVLVTGPTGTGKTTTLAAMVDLINNEREYLVVCIEDPIEYIHSHKRSIVKQRELYSDTRSFAQALRHALRQDPNVIVVGEMRDLETISTALTAAETGHLVLATLHTSDAPQTIDRIIDVFPPHQQQQIRVQLANSIQGVLSQQLLPRLDRSGRVVACEVMIATSAVRNLIRENETAQIPTLIQTSAYHGMKSMDKNLKELYLNGIISRDVALEKVKDTAGFEKL